MAHDGLTEIVRRLAIPVRYTLATDRELLAQFTVSRDQVAFEALVRRYARQVRSATAHVLTDQGDIDDAVQATFLVLVRRAARKDWRDSLGPWLFGVAHRVALKLRNRNLRRPDPLGDADPADPAPAQDAGWREACDLLHRELDRLPDRFRLPLLLCYLEGKTRVEAADELGITAGTVKGRLRRGCELLRRRLALGGVSLSVGLLATVTVSRPAIACPAAVITAAVDRAPSPRVTQIVLEVLRTMTPAKHALTALKLVVAVGLFAAAGLFVGFGKNPADLPVAAGAPAPKNAPPSIFLVENAGLSFLDADGKVKEKLGPFATNGALSPDGRRIAAMEFDAGAGRSSLVIRSRGEKQEPVTVQLVFGKPGRSGGLPVWSADGKRVLMGEENVGENEVREYAYRVYDLAARPSPR